MDEEEREYIEKAVDYAERWEETIKGKIEILHSDWLFLGREKWIRKPEFQGEVTPFEEALKEAKNDEMYNASNDKETEVLSKQVSHNTVILTPSRISFHVLNNFLCVGIDGSILLGQGRTNRHGTSN